MLWGLEEINLKPNCLTHKHDIGFLTLKKTPTAMEGGGGNLSELYSSSKRLSLKIRDALERLERLEFTSTSSSSLSSSSAVVAASSDDQPTLIRRDIGQIQSLCADMDRLWRSIPSKPQRDLWKRYFSISENLILLIQST